MGLTLSRWSRQQRQWRRTGPVNVNNAAVEGLRNTDWKQKLSSGSRSSWSSWFSGLWFGFSVSENSLHVISVLLFHCQEVTLLIQPQQICKSFQQLTTGSVTMVTVKKGKGCPLISVPAETLPRGLTLKCSEELELLLPVIFPSVSLSWRGTMKAKQQIIIQTSAETPCSLPFSAGASSAVNRETIWIYIFTVTRMATQFEALWLDVSFCCVTSTDTVWYLWDGRGLSWSWLHWVKVSPSADDSLVLGVIALRLLHFVSQMT